MTGPASGQGEPADGRVSRIDMQRLKREARTRDAPSPEEQAFQDGWDAAFASRDEARTRAAKQAKTPRPTPAVRAEPPRRRRGLRETVRLAYVLAGYPPPGKRKGPA